MSVVEQLSRTSIPSVDDLTRRAEKMVPSLSAGADKTEALRMLPPETMAMLFEAGFLRIFQPERFGGYEMDWGTQTKIGSVIAKGCSSASWITCVVGSHAAYVGRMAPRAQEDVWGDKQDILIATGSVPRGVSIRRVDGGFELNGKWSFLSGIDYASWCVTRGFPDGEDKGPQYYFLYPRSDFTIEDDWYVSGMRGTGSKSVRLDRVFVPEYRSIALPVLMSPNPPGADVNRGYVYRYNFRAFAGTAMLGPIMGTAEAAFSVYLDSLKQGQFPYLDVEDPSLQLLIAESDAEIGTARLLLDTLVDRQHSYGSSGKSFAMADRVALVRDRTFAARLVLNAVERLVRSLDCVETFNEHPLHRQHRDLCAMVQQIGINWDRNMSSCGKKLLGLPTEIPFLNKE